MKWYGNEQSGGLAVIGDKTLGLVPMWVHHIEGDIGAEVRGIGNGLLFKIHLLLIVQDHCPFV